MKGKSIKKKTGVVLGPSLLTDHDIYLFKEGNHFGLYEKLGSHLMTVDGAEGVAFRGLGAERGEGLGDRRFQCMEQ